MKKKLVFILILFMIGAWPIQTMAVEFSITDVTIDAYLQKNGDVRVTEVHSYSFDDKFRGITREIIPKKGAEITDFTANEGEKELKVKKEKDLYKVSRSGSDENIRVELHYMIKNGLSKHPDITEFYWPFFDKRDEADYGNMTITVHPPAETDDVIAFGYDESFGKEKVGNSGAVTFQLHKVEAGENGDIRVAYDSALFPDLTETSDQEMRQTLLDEQQKLIDKAQTFAENRKKTASVGKWFLLIFGALFIGVITSEATKSKQRKRAAKNEINSRKYMIPKQKLSMPAILYFLYQFSPELLAAALMDLVRKGYVRQVSKDRFLLLDGEAEKAHEKILLRLLFEKVGGNKTFTLNDLEQYIQLESNHDRYEEEISRWKHAIKKEIDQSNLYENNPLLKWTLGTTGTAMLIASSFFIVYDLYGLMFQSGVLGLASLCLAIFYRPISYEGLLLKEEWNKLEKEYEQIPVSEWEHSSEDDKKRLLIYSMGTKKNRLADYFSQVIQKNETSVASYSTVDVFFYSGLTTASSFALADEHIMNTASADSSDTSSSTFSGGGVDGGGGGSGAF